MPVLIVSFLKGIILLQVLALGSRFTCTIMVAYFANFASNKYSTKPRVKSYFSNLIDLNYTIKVIKISILTI